MGNCFTGKSSLPEKGKSGAGKPNNESLHTEDDEEAVPKHYVGPIHKRTRDETSKPEIGEAERQAQIEAAKCRRNERKAIGRIKKGEDTSQEIFMENAKKVDRKKTQADWEFIIKSLKTHFVFFNLSPSELENIVGKMFYCEIEADEYIFKQGDKASSYFIIEKGTMDVIINDQSKRRLTPGESFGELALLYNAPRSGSIKAMEKCQLWAIDRVTFRKAIEEMNVKEYDENRKFIENVRFFASMTVEQKDALAGGLMGQRFTPGQPIVVEGDPASSYYIIKEGTVAVTRNGMEVRRLTKGDAFGEQALFYNTVRAMSVVAVDNVRVLGLGRETVTKLLGDQVQLIIFRNLQRWAFEKSPILSKLTKMQTDKVIDGMKIQNFKAGDIVFNKGTTCNRLIVVLEGALKKVNMGALAVKGVLFGDEYLLEINRTHPKVFDQDVVMDADGVLSEITIAEFQNLLSGTIEEIMKRNENSHEKALINRGENAEKQAASSLTMSDLIFMKKLGYGQFGSVYLVKGKTTGKYYALKCISKVQITEENLEKHLIQEKNVLEKMNFPFIMQFYKTFKDGFYVYFLIEFVRGMELFDVIREIGLLSHSDSQFYLGSLILSLEYLHGQSIIYRDIKPENIMIDHQGYVKVIDMGTAKILEKGASRTFTIIGTPHYMAPEILTGKGYTFTADLWSVGICLYEFMCGMVPFGEEAEDPYEIYEEIIKKDINFPPYMKDKKAKAMMEQLLNKTPEARLGGNYTRLKNNKFFDKFDWDKLMSRDLQAPLLPPEDRMVSEAEMKKMELAGRPVLEEIKEDLGENMKGEPPVMKNDWDKDFQSKITAREFNIFHNPQ